MSDKLQLLDRRATLKRDTRYVVHESCQTWRQAEACRTRM